jgi:hypothetical protein
LTYASWQEPVRLLELSIGPSTSSQRALADRLGFPVQGDEPYGILGVMLEEHIRPQIWGAEAVGEPASERQRRFLKSLGGPDIANSPRVTKRLASAWIDHYLAATTAEFLRRLQLKTDDAVIRRTTWNKTVPTIAPHEMFAYHRVSSIGADGLVYFKGGNGKCGWPSSLRLADPEDDPTSYPQTRPLGDEGKGALAA